MRAWTFASHPARLPDLRLGELPDRLERFDTMPGRRVDNVGFFAVDDIGAVPDTELYDRLLSEFPDWMAAARRAGIL
ncbi:hypothetical protein AF335_12630 [Streptomyces eurocidicus]|uniref:vWA found in TerF C terminus domain-containing protein n=1 Tax=Streptomyces eurocidicus TaxID=66423 RepID=A0A2N8NY20_STREU|nr:hypothetical protein [Streptomyces eurocidicus]PNE33671.1 hypothetical protein AF335_12630 [Streptomyces eurocidicus]